MPPLAWLVIAVVAGVVGWAVGWPAWQQYRARESSESNTERYLAWRGRAPSGDRPTEGMTGEERRRIYAGAALAVVAIVALLAFFGTS
jgi:hypothetical protein